MRVDLEKSLTAKDVGNGQPGPAVSPTHSAQSVLNQRTRCFARLLRTGSRNDADDGRNNEEAAQKSRRQIRQDNEKRIRRSQFKVAFLSEEEVFSVATVARRWKALVFNHVNHALASVARFFHGLSEEDYPAGCALLIRLNIRVTLRFRRCTRFLLGCFPVTTPCQLRCEHRCRSLRRRPHPSTR